MNSIDRRGVMIGLGAASALAAFPAFAAADPILADVIRNDSRTPEEKARDIWRHPEASLLFWGLKPGEVVIDVAPGTGWWTDMLAPYLARTGGRYIAATADLNDPKTSDGARKGRAAFESKYEADPKLYGNVSAVGFGQVSGPLAAPGTVDLVLVSREIHDWAMVDGFVQKAFGDFHAALKRGGVLAIEDHRAVDGADPKKGDGYISEAYVIGEAKKAGFVLTPRTILSASGPCRRRAAARRPASRPIPPSTTRNTTRSARATG